MPGIRPEPWLVKWQIASCLLRYRRGSAEMTGAGMGTVDNHARRRLGFATSRIVVVACTATLLGAAPAALSGTGAIDLTYSCAVKFGPHPHYVDISANAKTPQGNAAYGFVFTALKVRDKQFIPQLHFDSAAKSLTIDASLCRRSTKAVPLPPSNSSLPSGGTITVNFGGVMNERCSSAGRVLVRARLQQGSHGATHVQLAVANDDARKRPLAYVNWTPTRVVYSTAASCVHRTSGGA